MTLWVDAAGGNGAMVIRGWDHPPGGDAIRASLVWSGRQDH